MHWHWSTFNISSVGHRSSSRYSYSILNHLINSWTNVSSSSFIEVWICLSGSFLVKNNGVNFSNSEIDSLGKFILIINFNPFFNKSSWNVLNILWDIKCSKLFLLHNEVVFGCLWWLSELRSIWSFLSHLSKDFMSFIWIKVWDWKQINILIFSFWITYGSIFLKSLFTSNVQNGFYNSHSLYINKFNIILTLHIWHTFLFCSVIPLTHLSNFHTCSGLTRS